MDKTMNLRVGEDCWERVKLAAVKERVTMREWVERAVYQFAAAGPFNINLDVRPSATTHVFESRTYGHPVSEPLCVVCERTQREHVVPCTNERAARFLEQMRSTAPDMPTVNSEKHWTPDD